MNGPRPGPSVFVYGTLMPGEYNEPVARLGGPFTVRPARLPGFALYHLEPEGYPALVPARQHSLVRGYVLTYRPDDWPRALPHLDRLEGLDETPPLYARRAVTPEGERDPVWVYVYARPERLRQEGAHPVPGGDWTAHRSAGAVPART